jgi:hypothetical protein
VIIPSWRQAPPVQQLQFRYLTATESGLYEKLMTAKLGEKLADLGEQHDLYSAPVDSADSTLILARQQAWLDGLRTDGLRDLFLK